jgi:hypothetical protein
MKKTAPANPAKIDSKLLMDVRDRLIARGHPEDLGAGGVQSCLDDGVSFHPAELLVCQQAAIVRQTNKNGVGPAVMRYVLGELTVSFSDGFDHLVIMISPDDSISQIVRIDAHGVPSSSVLTPDLRDALIKALMRATSLPLIEA